jgi:CRP-like cAMP-binding protein
MPAQRAGRVRNKGERMAAREVEAGVGACATCPLGAASGVGHGGRCPLVDRRRRAGTYLYLEGGAAEKVWFIKHGRVVLSREGDDRRGEGIAWTARGPGSMLGIEALVRPTYLDSARAVIDTTVCTASREAMQGWIGSREGAARTVLELVLLAQSVDTPRRSGSDGNAVRRVASWLLEDPRGTSPELPRRVIAGFLGMLPETLSRALKALSERGAIATTRRQVRIVDRRLLEAAAHPGPVRVVDGSGSSETG